MAQALKEPSAPLQSPAWTTGTRCRGCACGCCCHAACCRWCWPRACMQWRPRPSGRHRRRARAACRTGSTCRTPFRQDRHCRITAAQAERYGLVEHVVPDGRAVPFAEQTATRIARAPKGATQAIKLAVRRGLVDGLAAGLALEATLAGALFADPAAREAVTGFRMRRQQQKEI